MAFRARLNMQSHILSQSNTRRRLSSLQTFFTKFIFPAFWLTLWGVFTIATFLGRMAGANDKGKWILPVTWFVGAGFLYWFCGRLKKVSVDENFLYVSNYFKELAIPLSEIFDVTENRWVNTNSVTIHFARPTEFGSKIVFMPTIRVFGFFSSHPVVEELQELVERKSRSGNYFRTP
jgi:hypothetical protein